MKTAGVLIAMLLAGAVGAAAGWWLHTPISDSALRQRITELDHQQIADGAVISRERSALAKAQANRMQPPCPTPTYGADGTAGPLTCTVVDPANLAYFQRMYPDLLALGPNATPQQVQSAIDQDFKSNPTACDAYTIATTLNHWSFGIPMMGRGGITIDQGSC